MKKEGKEKNKKEETETKKEKQETGKEEKPKRTHGRKEKKETAEEPEKKEEVPELEGASIKGLFGETKKSRPGKEEPEEMKLNLGLENEMEELDEEGEESMFNLEEENETSQEKKEKGKCVNCGQEFNELIFCSKCGNAFCDKCAKIKQAEGTKTKYVCPHCGHVTKK